MKVLYFDCSSGISGNMTLGALSELIDDPHYLVNELKKLNVDGYHIHISKEKKNDITGTYVDVHLEHEHHHEHEHEHLHHEHAHHHHHEHRNLFDVNKIIDESEILYIRRDGMKLIFHTKSRDYETYSSFNKIMDSLPSNFVRAHKSFIVNIDNIANLDSIGNIVYFDNGSTCEIGPKFKKSLIEEVNNNERSK